jgi:hypothetical protein
VRIGTLGYRTKTGLGYQIHDYVKHLPVTKVLAIDLSGFNGVPLTDWYPEARTVKGYPTHQDLSDFLTDIDVVLLAETPLNYDLYRMARQRGIKTAVAPNWEFWDYFVSPHYHLPDLMIMPSMWRYDEAQQFANERGIKCIYLHHPVDREVFKFTPRTTKELLHTAGKPAAYDRNGTNDFLAVVQEGVIIIQNEKYANVIRSQNRHLRVLTNVENVENIYQYGDIFSLT